MKPAGETERHFQLKRLALAWAQQNGFRIAAAEVSLPQFRFRLDVAAYRPESAPRENARGQLRRQATLGATAIFECKQSRADFMRDARCAQAISERLLALQARRLHCEQAIQIHLPSQRNGDALFPEFDGYRFHAAGYRSYDRLLVEIQRLTARLHKQTKLQKLTKWEAANLFYLVAEPNVAEPFELPPGWGLLLRREEVLELAVPAMWRTCREDQRLNLLVRIAASGTRAVNQALGVVNAWDAAVV